jgi:hypothetical protein
MSITEWLGKYGVLGFRSGRKWKMAIATIGYLFLILFIIIPFMYGFTHPESRKGCPNKIRSYDVLL